MIEVVFLICLGLVGILIAVIQDLRKREVANWVNFSLIIFAMGFRFFWSLFNIENVGFSFFYQGLIGLGIFFVIGNAFYYSRIFAGGDAKLMIALGAIIPIYYTLVENIYLYIGFLLLFLIVGALYGLISSLYLALKSRKAFVKEFDKQYKANKYKSLFVMLLGLLIMILGLKDGIFLAFGILVFIIPYFYLFAKSVDEACMIKSVSYKELSEGDWLYKNVKVGNKTIRANWEGLSKEDIKLISRKKKSVLIRIGIPFTPVFLVSFVALVSIILMVFSSAI